MLTDREQIPFAEQLLEPHERVKARIVEFDQFVDRELKYYERGLNGYRRGYEAGLLISVVASVVTPVLVRLQSPIPATISALLASISVSVLAAFRLRDTYLRKAHTFMQLSLEKSLYRARCGEYFALRHDEEGALNEYCKRVYAIIQSGVRDWRNTTLRQGSSQDDLRAKISSED